MSKASESSLNNLIFPLFCKKQKMNDLKLWTVQKLLMGRGRSENGEDYLSLLAGRAGEGYVLHIRPQHHLM